MSQPKLGELLFKRSGITFWVDAPVPASLEIGPIIDEAILWGRKTGLSVLLSLPKLVIMTVESSSDRTRLTQGWQAFLSGSRQAYLGRDYSAAHRGNEKERARRLRNAPRTITVPDSAGWAELKRSAQGRGDVKAQIELAERWARLMEQGRKNRMRPRDNVYTSLYLADPYGLFNPDTRRAILQPLASFWPLYEDLIREHLDAFRD